MRVLISGASGLVGTELAKQLRERGHEPIRLVRRAAVSADEISWDPSLGAMDSTALDGIDAVVNLAGATTGKIPWTPKYKRELIDSRLDSTRTLVNAINAAAVKPKVFVSGSASGFYGEGGDTVLTETAPNGSGFLAELAGKWEAEAGKVDSSVRLVLIRTTMVMSQKLGALGRLLPLIRLGLGGPLGNGKQWWAWISLVDEAGAIIHLIENSAAVGAFNLTAPEPARCIDVVRALAKNLHRPAVFPAPAFALRLLLGEAAQELLLVSANMSAQKLAASGFVFKHPRLQDAADWVTNG